MCSTPRAETRRAMTANNPHTVEGIFNDLTQRRKGLIKALTQGTDNRGGFAVGGGLRCMGRFDLRGVGKPADPPRARRGWMRAWPRAAAAVRCTSWTGSWAD